MRAFQYTLGLVFLLGFLFMGCPCDTGYVTGPEDGLVEEAPPAPDGPAVE